MIINLKRKGKKEKKKKELARKEKIITANLEMINILFVCWN